MLIAPLFVLRKTIIPLTALALVIATGTDARALSTVEIVNHAKSAVVAIMLMNSATKEGWEATGWFVSGHRIVTNSHVISTVTYDTLQIVNIATGEPYTVNHLAYNNTATDVAVLVVNETNATSLALSSLRPAEGLRVVVIGNPNEQYGKVVTGTLGPSHLYGLDKRENWTVIKANIQKGSSGSPVLDSNGDVIGMIWGDAKDDPNIGLAVTLSTLQLAQLEIIDLNLDRIAGTPAPAASPSPVVPTIAEKRWVEINEPEIGRLLSDYLTVTNKQRFDLLAYCVMLTVDRYYNRYNLTLEQVITELKKDAKKYPGQWTYFEPDQVRVLKDMTLENQYVAILPFTWKGKDNGKMVSITSRLYAKVELGDGVKDPTQRYYRITALWNEEKK
jgi:hypothetical protein